MLTSTWSAPSTAENHWQTGLVHPQHHNLKLSINDPSNALYHNASCSGHCIWQVTLLFDCAFFAPCVALGELPGPHARYTRKWGIPRPRVLTLFGVRTWHLGPVQNIDPCICWVRIGCRRVVLSTVLESNLEIPTPSNGLRHVRVKRLHKTSYAILTGNGNQPYTMDYSPF